MSDCRFDFGPTNSNSRNQADARLKFSLIKSGNIVPKPLEYKKKKISALFKEYPLNKNSS